MALHAASPLDRSPSIEISNLRRVYPGGHVALSDVNLVIESGLVGLLGPNGAGKSTLMRIICALVEPSEGEVRIGGYDVRTDRLGVRGKIGYLPQDFGGWRLHRVEEVLDTLARLSGLHSRATRKERVAEVIEQVGLGEVARRKVKKLSGGMVRRLGVAQALIHEPDILVVDEPTVGLDPEERIRFRQLMADIGRDRTILLSTHIVADLGAACREIALLDDGTIVFQGPPADLVGLAEGKVFSVAVSAAASERIEAEYEVVSRAVQGGEVVLRGVAVDRLPDGAEVIEEPTLEESYMAFMAARGRSEAARQDDETDEPAPNPDEE